MEFKLFWYIYQISFFCLNFTDIDECSSMSNPCMENSVCSNTKGSYVCTCKPGYLDIGHSCKGDTFQPTNMLQLVFFIKYFKIKALPCDLLVYNKMCSFVLQKQTSERKGAIACFHDKGMLCAIHFRFCFIIFNILLMLYK